ncbi:MAG TPA: hypothetical protein VKG86_04385 [Terracidiphilus sp.]|nr:hypothetical protein [Terracidiphilus sp.]
MSSVDDAKWHWAEGIKFALEGVKLLFILNGAASVSILTFIGNMKASSSQLIWALLSFAFGAATTVPAMIFAYFTQLQYGNASQDEMHGHLLWQKAGKRHYTAYGFIVLGILCFLIGAILAACGLMHIQSSNVPCQNHP